MVGPPFTLITASVRRGMKAISLWHSSGVIEAQVALNLLCLIQVWRVCWPIKHSITMVVEPAFGTFGSVGRCQVLLENEISISIKLVSRRKHEVL